MDTIRRYSMLIGGDWVDADEQFEIRSPATGELVASVAKGERIDEFALLEAQENGAPVRQAGAFQIGFSVAHLRYFAGQAAGATLAYGGGVPAGPHALDEYTEEKFVHVDLSGRLDRRAYPLLLSTPPG